MPLLEVRSVSKRFGGVAALNKMSLHLNEGEIMGLIGPNGAGKTSFFNCITGLLPIDEGDIFFEDEKINLKALLPHKILKVGVARTFQNLRIFKNITLLENIAIGFHSRTRSGLWDAFLKTKRSKDEEKMIFEESIKLLQLMGLENGAMK